MPESTEPKDIDALAALHDGLGHPIRVCILLTLRKEKRMLGTKLRKRVSEMYIPIDARNLQFHLFKMQVSGIVSVKKEANRDVIELVQDVVIRAKAQ